jgi:hypothetical protein
MKPERDRDLSPRDYEREAELTRYRLAHNLDELSARLTPGQVFDEVLTYAKGGGGTLLRAFANATRENPIPSLLIGAGCMMFLSEKTGLHRLIANRYRASGASVRSAGDSFVSGAELRVGEAASYGADLASDTGSRMAGAASRATDATAAGLRSASNSIRSGVRRTGDFASDQASNVAEGVKSGAAAVGDTLSAAGRSVGATASDLGDQVAGAAGQMTRGMQSMSESVQEYSSSMAGQLADSAAGVRQQAMHATQQVKASAASFIDQQPLLCAAIGLAVGAAIAAMIPSTETENELMGEASDAVKGAVGEAASQQLQTAKEAAEKVASQAKSAAESEGLIPSGAGDIARNVGEKVKRVVRETGAAAESEMHDLAGQTRTR